MLGVSITNNFADIYSNFDTVKDKIERSASYWERFRLSLTGRIVIGKSLLVSQLNYLGSIIKPPEDLLKKIQGIIDNFSIGKQKVGKDRLYKKPSEGGLGLINLSRFLSAQQAGWVVKAGISTRDNWRVDLKNLSYGIYGQ